MDSSFNNDDLLLMQQKYRANIGAKLCKIQQLMETFKSAPSKSNLSALRLEIHKLAGSAGLYGFVKVSELCHSMDSKLLEKLQANNLEDDSLEIEAVSLFYAQLEKFFNQHAEEV